jgi:hypothetical protein
MKPAAKMTSPNAIRSSPSRRAIAARRSTSAPGDAHERLRHANAPQRRGVRIGQQFHRARHLSSPMWYTPILGGAFSRRSYRASRASRGRPNLRVWRLTLQRLGKPAIRARYKPPRTNRLRKVQVNRALRRSIALMGFDLAIVANLDKGFAAIFERDFHILP